MKLVYQMNRRGPGKIHADDGTGKPMCKKSIVNGWNSRITETSEGEPSCKTCAKLASEPDYKTLKRWHSEALETVYKQQRMIEDLEARAIDPYKFKELLKKWYDRKQRSWNGETLDHASEALKELMDYVFPAAPESVR
jgi:hypothetical protein